MKLELCSFELAKMLKEVGFDWSTYVYFDLNNPFTSNRYVVNDGYSVKINYNDNNRLKQNTFSAPTIELAKMWFREVHDQIIEVNRVLSGHKLGYVFKATYNDNGVIKSLNEFDTYNQALSAGLKEACKLIKID